MPLLKEQIQSISEEIQDVTDTIFRLKSIGNDTSIVYQELVDLIQSQFRNIDTALQVLNFEIEDNSTIEQKKSHLLQVEKVNEDGKT